MDLMCTAVTCKCSARAVKHASLIQVARTKLSTVHQHISKAMIDSEISDEEFTLITDEIEHHRTIKE